MRGPPVLLPPRAERYLSWAIQKAPAFVPSWAPERGDAGYAAAQAFSRFMATLATAVNAAPDKNKLAFYDLLGLSLLPASGARTPVAFAPVPNAGDQSVPAGTRVAAKGTDGQAIVFETSDHLVVPAAPLVEVRSVWPARDQVADHSPTAIRGKPFTWFEELVPVSHVLYLGHGRVLHLAGPSSVEVTLDLARPAETPIPLVWEYWDGTVWRRFKEPVASAEATPQDSSDGTLGLTRSGVVHLMSECADTEHRRVHTLESYWIRARVSGSLPADAILQPPEIERIHLQSAIQRGLPNVPCDGLGEADGLIPDAGYADEAKLDLTKSVQPLGAAPGLGSAFYLASDEALSRPGAEVEICFTKLKTPQEEADEAAKAFADDVSDAEEALIAIARNAADLVLQILESPSEMGVDLPTLMNAQRQAVQDARAGLATQGLDGVAALRDAVQDLADRYGPPPNALSPDIVVAVVTAILGRGNDLIQQFIQLPIAPQPFDFLGAVGATISSFLNLFAPAGGSLLPVINNLAWVNDLAQDAEAAIDDLRDATVDTAELLTALASDKLTGYTAAVAVGAVPPTLGEPVLVWEYWNGRRWRRIDSLSTAPTDPEVARLRRTGRVRFTVPPDLRAVEHAGVEAHWLRARLAGGAYGTLRLTSWQDQESLRINFFPIVEHRPPVIDRVRIGYVYRSKIVAPEGTFTYNDFHFEDYTREASVPSSTFVPYAPVADTTPAMYFGFDGELPAGELGMFFNVEEVIGEPAGPKVVWEGWDGGGWRELDATDETEGMALPGIVRLTWPGGPTVPMATALDAQGDTVSLVQPSDAVKFAAEDDVFVRNTDGGELATVAAVDGRRLRLSAPLGGSYGGGTVSRATLARFGTPRWWIRARLTEDVTPRAATVAGLYPGSVWAHQVQVIENEILSPSSGEPDQVLLVRHKPVVDELTLEVRELSGARARIERPLLMEDLATEGMGEADVREVPDPVTGEIHEVWVRWKEAPNRHFVPRSSRSFVLERSTGRIHFAGRVPPPGRDNLRVRRYQTARGSEGNLPALAIDQLMSGAVVQGATNVIPAQGASDGETAAGALERGPTVIRNRRQALTRGDYEELAREANSAVAVARALPATHPSGRHAPGWVTVQIVPHSDDSHPRASFTLRDSVRRFLEARVPAALVGRVHVVPAQFFDVGAAAAVRPKRGAAAAAVVASVEESLSEFFHPLSGGPDRRGWPFGRDVHVSDVAARLGELPSVELIESLTLLLAGSPVGQHVAVPPDRLVAPGMIQVGLAGGRD